MFIYTIFLYVLLGVTGLFILYYTPRLFAWFGSFKKQKQFVNTKKNRIAIIIPARDESKVIGDLFNSLQHQTYDRAYFDIHLALKNQNDPVIEMAKSVNGIVHIPVPQRSKAQALDGTIKDILAEDPNKYDAYLVIDADCMLKEDYLEQMNNALASGRQIIQAKKIVKNYHIKNTDATSLSSNCNGLIWTMIDDMGNRFKSDHNIIGMLIGTGIMMRSDVVKQLGGFPYQSTLTEDIELTYDCLIKKFTTFYYSYAVMYLEEATSLEVTNKRRSRWLTGCVESHRIYKHSVRKHIHSFHDLVNHYYVTGLVPLYYYFGFCTLFAVASAVTSLTFIALNSSLWLGFFLNSLASIGIIYAMFWCLTLLCLIVERKNMPISIWKKLVILFVHPAFYMGYIPIVAKIIILRENKGWEVIERIDYSICSNQETAMQRLPVEQDNLLNKNDNNQPEL